MESTENKLGLSGENTIEITPKLQTKSKDRKISKPKEVKKKLKKTKRNLLCRET